MDSRITADPPETVANKLELTKNFTVEKYLVFFK